MLRTILVLGAAILVAFLIIRLAFGMLGWVVVFLFQALIVGAIAYLIIRIFAPAKAKELRARLGWKDKKDI